MENSFDNDDQVKNENVASELGVAIPKQSNILSMLFKKVKDEQAGQDKSDAPRAHYVRGGHTQGVYHKQYNRY